MEMTYADKPWLKMYDKGVSATVDIPQETILDMLDGVARKHPQHAAINYKGKALTYQMFKEQIDAIAAALVASGFKKGDRAVIYMPNSPQFVISYFGIMKAGGIVIATNPLYTERELEHQLADCGAETVFVMSRYYPLLKSVQRKGHTQVKRIIVANIKEYFPFMLKTLFTLLREKKGGDRVKPEQGDMSFPDFLALGRRSPQAKVAVTNEDLAMLQYTGGTTGLAKGAIGQHKNLAANIAMLKEWLEWEEAKEGFVGAIPFFHSYGMITTMILSATMAATLYIVPDPRDQKDLLSTIDKYKPTLFPGVPAMYIAINNNPDVASGKYDVTSIRACISGSAPLLMETKRRFEELTGGKLVEGFGMTETFVATHCNPIEGENREGSIGLPLPGVECRIVDAAEGEKDLPVGEVGELLIKGPTVMKGYWNMPTETVNSLRDGWLYSGDIARMDEQGYFYIEDRKKDMIIAGGYNVYPREIEEVLMMHPAVVEAAVAGVPDPKRGETVKAWIVKKTGDATTEAEIVEWSKTQLAKYKYPRLIEFRSELPKTTVGKVLKRDLVKEYKAQLSETDQTT